MKNLIKKPDFGSSKSQQNAAIKNLAINLITHEHITTTKAKADAVKSFVEKIFARYTNDLTGQRLVEAKLGTKRSTDKIGELSQTRFKDINSGFVQVYRRGFRKGDGAQVFEVILNGYEPRIKSKLKKVKSATPEEEA